MSLKAHTVEKLKAFAALVHDLLDDGAAEITVISQTGLPGATVNRHLRHCLDLGLIYLSGERKGRRYFNDPQKASSYVAVKPVKVKKVRVVKATTTKRRCLPGGPLRPPKRLKPTWHKTEAVNPNNVQKITCPCGRDTRYTPDKDFKRVWKKLGIGKYLPFDRTGAPI